MLYWWQITCVAPSYTTIFSASVRKNIAMQWFREMWTLISANKRTERCATAGHQTSRRYVDNIFATNRFSLLLLLLNLKENANFDFNIIVPKFIANSSSLILLYPKLNLNEHLLGDFGRRVYRTNRLNTINQI